jgi:hypothetical protein
VLAQQANDLSGQVRRIDWNSNGGNSVTGSGGLPAVPRNTWHSRQMTCQGRGATYQGVFWSTYGLEWV